MEKASDYFEKYVDTRFDSLERQFGDFKDGMERQFSDFRADLRETVREAAANNARLAEMIQAEVHSQNERRKSIEARIDNLRWWILGTGMVVFVGMAGLVYALHQSNQQLISVLTQYILK